MALSMDSLTAPTLAQPATPREAPLAMPVQSLRKFDRRERRRPVVARPVGALALARLVIFGGAAALTVYGAREMYGVVAVGEITTLEWALVVLFVVNFAWIAFAFTSSVYGFVWLLRAPPLGAAAAAAREQDRGGDADLQRGAGARLRRGAGDLRRRARDRARRPLRLFLPLRHHQSRHLDRRGARAAGDARAAAGRARLLPPPPQEHRPQGRQHRRFRHALGRGLSADAGARRRQRDVGRDDRPPRRGDGGRSRRRHRSRACR